MKRYRELTVLGVLLSVAGQTLAAEPPDKEGLASPATPPKTAQSDLSRIDHLIRQLGSSNFSEREAATRALDAIGEPAWDALSKAKGSDDPETRHRAAKLMQSLRRANASQGASWVE